MFTAPPLPLLSSSPIFTQKRIPSRCSSTDTARNYRATLCRAPEL